ncbi:hypothetical protein LJR186_000876 [Microbacterium foliorum]
MTEFNPATYVTVVFEDVALENIGLDPAPDEYPELIAFCRSEVTNMAADPTQVRLVIVGDMVEAIKRRLPAGPERDSFDADRGAGMLAAKTMVVGDEVHVIVPAWCFLDTQAMRNGSTDAEFAEFVRTAPARERMIRRTVVHEAQHVAMDQAGEDDADYPDAHWVRKTFLGAAHQVAVEYRAELGVRQELREDYETTFPAESLGAFRSDARELYAAYSTDVSALSYYLMVQAIHLWKAFGYVAAARRVDGIEAALAVPQQERALWEQMGAVCWERFEQALAKLEAADTRIVDTEFRATVAQLADLLDEWFVELGFSWRDVENGRNTWFEVVSGHLLI